MEKGCHGVYSKQYVGNDDRVGDSTNYWTYRNLIKMQGHSGRWISAGRYTEPKPDGFKKVSHWGCAGGNRRRVRVVRRRTMSLADCEAKAKATGKVYFSWAPAGVKKGHCVASDSCYKPNPTSGDASNFWGYQIIPQNATPKRKADVNPKAVPVDQGKKSRYCLKDCNWGCYLDNNKNLKTKKKAETDYLFGGPGGKKKAGNCRCKGPGVKCRWSSYMKRYPNLRNKWKKKEDPTGEAIHHFLKIGQKEGQNCKAYRRW